MITLYISIVIILFAYFLSQSVKNKKQTISKIGICSICDQTFEDHLIIEDDTLSFCVEHFRFYKEFKWVIVETVECSVGNEADSVSLYQKKKELYFSGTLGYLKPSYKNVGNTIVTVLDYYQIKKP
jgi:hypothetical protein